MNDHTPRKGSHHSTARRANFQSASADAKPIAPKPILRCLADVVPVRVQWLWPQRIALGKLTLIAGDPGLGKSFISLEMAARISTGRAWPDQPGEYAPIGGTVLLSAEDGLDDTIRPRLDAAGADVSKIKAIEGVLLTDEDADAKPMHVNLERDVAALEAAIDATPDCRLVVIDPLTAYLGKIDSHNNAEVRGVLALLSDLAARKNVAIVGVTHLNKASSMSAAYRTMGSLAFVAAARAVWAVARDKEDPEGRRRLVLPVKNNLGNDRTGLAYRLNGIPGGPAWIEWEPDPVDTTADDALAPATGRDDDGPALGEAKAWLRGELADGPQPATDIKKQASKDGIKSRTLDRAKEALNVTSYRDGKTWWWKLPDDSRAGGIGALGDVGALGALDGFPRKNGQPVADQNAKHAKDATPASVAHLNDDCLLDANRPLDESAAEGEADASPDGIAPSHLAAAQPCRDCGGMTWKIVERDGGQIVECECGRFIGRK